MFTGIMKKDPSEVTSINIEEIGLMMQESQGVTINSDVLNVIVNRLVFRSNFKYSFTLFNRLQHPGANWGIEFTYSVKKTLEKSINDILTDKEIESLLTYLNHFEQHIGMQIPCENGFQIGVLSFPGTPIDDVTVRLVPLTSEEVTKLYNSFVKAVEKNFSDENLRSQIIIGAGGAMLMMGLRENTNDLDLSVPEKVFNYFGKVFGITQPSDHSGIKIVSVAPQVDIHLSFNPTEAPDYPVMEYNGVYYEGAEKTLWLKQQLNRPKDQEDIRKLKAYILNK